MTADVTERVRQVMADILQIDLAAIGDDTSMDTVEQWDSANHINLVLALEEEFGVAFDVGEIEAMTSFPSVVAGVLAKA
jgi:acyl carrier protein